MDKDNSNGYSLSKTTSFGSVEDLGSLLEGKNYGKLMLFNSKNELLVVQRNEEDTEYPMHYSIIDFIADKENNTLSQIIDQADKRKKIKISYCHHNNPEDTTEEKLYLIKFNNNIMYQDKKMKKTFWANSDKLKELRTSHDYVLTPLFKKIIISYDSLYEELSQIRGILNLGDLEYYDTSLEKQYMLYLPYSYMQSCGGKKFRSTLIDLCSTWFSIDKPVLNSLKNIIETIHCCTLIIDDIEDSSQTRRKCKCAHLIYGEPLTLNAAYLKLFTLLNELDHHFENNLDETRIIILKSMKHLHLGQGADIYWMTKKYCPSIDQYLNMIDEKTGALIVLLLELALLHSNLEESELKNLQIKITEFFKLFGRFFQIRDDYINLTSFTYWKEKGLCTDIEEGKFTYPIILSMTELGNYDELYDIITSADRYQQDKKLQALDIMQRSGSLLKTRKELDSIKEELILLSKNISDNGIFESIMHELNY